MSGDCRVRPQPMCLREGKSIFVTKGDAGAVNERRCREAAHHLLAAGILCEAASELCSFEGICARARCGEGFVLQQQLLHLAPRIREGTCLRDLQASHSLNQLHRVEHYSRWLQKDMSTISMDPEVETITSCSRQPIASIAREDLNIYWNLTSAGFRDFFTITATDDWIIFGDSHMIPHEDIALCEGWPKGTHASVELFRCANVLQAPWAPRR